MTQPFKPSSFYPDYFKEEIHLGSENELQFSKALDEMMNGFLIARCRDLSRYTPDTGILEAIQRYLGHLGFQLGGILPEKVTALYQRRMELFQLRGTWAGLDLLASFHFTSFDSQQGYPFEQKRFFKTKLSPFRILEQNHKNSQISYRLHQDESPQVIQTFLDNSFLFTPQNIKIVVALPKQNLKSNKASLFPRRI